MKQIHASIFFWCTGQEDNIGDVVLRRQLIEAISGETSSNRRLHVYVGNASPSFVDGLNLPHETQRYSSKTSWLLALLKSAMTYPRPTLIYNPGELQRDYKTAIAYTSLVAPAAIIRARGGLVIRSGTAMATNSNRAEAHLATLIVRISSRLASLATWRDNQSAQEIGRGRVVPDWAIQDQSSKECEPVRPYILATYRADRPNAFSSNTLATLKLLATTTELDVALYCQVRRDSTAMRTLAELNGWLYFDWDPANSHSKQEELVRDLMRKSTIICSNRIHALIMGMQEGAQAVCISSQEEPKVKTHLTAFELAFIANTSSLGNAQQRHHTIEKLLSSAGSQTEALSIASTRVKALHNEIAQLIESDSGDPSALRNKATRTRHSLFRKVDQ